MRGPIRQVLDRLFARARHARRSERGFTLVEVVASVVILGIIAVPLGTAMVVGFRTVFGAEASMARASDAQQLSAYFPSDVASVDATGVNPTDSNNVAICAANPLRDETSLITFVWNEDLGISGESMARYIAEGSGTDSKIVRRFCRGAADPTQPASVTNDWTDITLASHFGTTTTPTKAADQYTKTIDPSAPVPGGTTPQCDAKSCFIEIHGAYDYRLNANRRVAGQNPNARPPDAPTAVHGVPGNQRVTLYWTDGNTNGSALTSYTIETQPGTAVLYPTPPNSGTSGVQVTGLTNATSYKFRVKATNSAGSSAYSDWSDVIVPGPTTPDPPTIGTATPSPTVNGSVTVTWSIPPGYNDGGAAIVGYRVYALNSPDAPVILDVNSAAATSATVTGLADNTNYTLQVTARNLYGEGSPSAPSNAALTLPGQPGTPNVQASGTAGTVVVTFSPPSVGDFANITNFRAQVTGRGSPETAVASATACPSGSSGTCSLSVSGLGTGQTYTIAVQAQNATGWGPLSAAATGVEVTPPTIGTVTIAPQGAPVGGFLGQGNQYYVYANATDASGIASVTANLNNITTGATAANMTTAGGPWTINGTTYTYRSALQTAKNPLTGTPQYTITAIDTFANSASSNFNVTMDNTAPVVTLTKVSGVTQTFPYSTKAASITSVGGACTSAASDIATVSIATTGASAVDGTATCGVGGANTWTYTFATPISAEGIYTFVATQSDYAGNTGTTAPAKTVNLDRTAPTISGSILASTTDTTVGGYVKPSGTYYIYANVTDSISGVNTVNANVSSITTSGATNVALVAGSYTVGATTYNYRSASMTASAITTGAKTFTVTAVDNATNTAGPTSFPVTVEGTPPTISGSVIASSTDTTNGGFVRTNGGYFVYSNVTDASPGVATVTANVTNLTTGTTAAALGTAGGPWTIGATTYAYRSNPLTVSGSVTAGTKTFNVTAADWAGNTVTSGNVNVTVDNTAPTVSITKVNNATQAFPYTTNQDVTTVGGTCSTGASDSTTVNITITGTDNETGTATCAASAWTYTLSPTWTTEGTSTIAANQLDFAGNTGNATNQNVTIDKTVPVVTLTTPADGLLTNDTTPALTGTCTVGQGNVAVTIAGPTNTTVPNITCTAGGTWSSTSPALTSGAGYTAVAKQTDAAGNTGTSNTNGFTVDATGPTVSSIIAASGDTTVGGFIKGGGTFFVYANATDALSGVTSVSSTLPTTFMTSSTTAPLTTTGGPWTIGATTYSYRSAQQTSKASATVGANTYTVVATDGATNQTTITPSVTVDNTAPTPTITSVNGSARAFPYFTNQNVTTIGGTCSNAASDLDVVNVTITGTAAGSGTASCVGTAWTYTLSSAWTAEGSSTFSATQADAAGNTGTAPSQTVTIDKTVPVVTLVAPANGLVTTDTTPAVSGACTTGQGTVTVTISGPTNASVPNITCTAGAWSSNSSTLSSGAGYTAVATQTDAAGNTGTSNTNGFTVDATGPTVSSIIAASSDTTTGGFIKGGGTFYVYANATDALSGVASVSSTLPTTFMTSSTTAPLSTAGGPWTVGATSYAYRSALQTSKAAATVGANTYTVVASDTVGNQTTITPSVTVDNTAPAPTVTNVNGLARTFPYATNVNVTTVGGTCGNGAGDLGTVSVAFTGADTESGTTACTGGAWTYTLVTAWSAEGSGTVAVTQSDAAGNSGTSPAKTIIEDKTLPTVPSATIAMTSDTTVGGVIKPSGNYYIYANASDALSGVSVVTANVTNITAGQVAVPMVAGSYTVGATTYGYRSAQLTSSSSTTTPKSYTVTAIDAANNSGVGNFSVTIDSTGPTITTPVIGAVGSPTVGYIGSGNDYYVYATVSDANGISSVTANVTNVTTGTTAAPMTAGSYTVGATTYNYRSAVLTASTLVGTPKTFTITATDVATNPTTTAATNVIVDSTAPAPTITKVNGATVTFPLVTNVAGGVTSVGGTCSTGATDIATVNVTISGDYDLTTTATCSAGAWTASVSPTWNTDGVVSVAASQDDFAGNTGNATPRAITLDRAAPVISATVIASTTDLSIGGFVRQGGTYYVYANVNDATSSVSTVTANASNLTTGQTNVSLASGSFTVGGVTYNRRSASLTANASLTAGTKTYTVTATDAAGNSGTTPNQNVTVDNTKPAPTNITLNNTGTAGTAAAGDFVVITYSEGLDPDSMCTGWTTPGDQSTTATVSISTGDALTVGSPCANLGSIALNGNYNSSIFSTRSFSNSTISWDESAHQLTITLGTPSGGTAGTNVANSTPAYTPTANLTDSAGNTMATTVVNGTSSRF